MPADNTPTEFPEIGVRLSRDEWLCIILALSGRHADAETLQRAEGRIRDQLNRSGLGGPSRG